MTTPDKPTSRAVYYAIRRVFQFIAWCLTRLEVTGLENVPPTGGFLIVVNHLSVADPAVLYLTIPRQCIMFSADKWKTTPGISHLANTVGVIWVQRGEVDRAALKQSLDFLKTGWPVGIAPEGTRSKDGVLHPGKPGAAYLADRARVPVLPVVVMGTEQLGRNLKRLRRTPVRCVYGRPFLLPSNGRAKTEELDALTDLIMCHLAALLDPQYRGAYATHPQLKELLGESDSEGAHP